MNDGGANSQRSAALDTGIASTSATIVHGKYPESPWKFSPEQKAQMASRLRNRTFIGVIDAYLITRMGEYVDPEEIAEALRQKNWTGFDTKSVVNNMVVRTSNQRSGKSPAMPYQIVRPSKPSGLMPGTHLPFVLVPVAQVPEVLTDESWAVPFLRNETKESVVKVMRGERKKKFDRFVDRDVLADFDPEAALRDAPAALDIKSVPEPVPKPVVSSAENTPTDSHASFFPKSPWVADADTKARFIDYLGSFLSKHYNVPGSVSALAHQFFIEHAGEYLHIREIFEGLQRLGYDGTIDMLSKNLHNILSKNSRDDRCPYLIFRFSAANFPPGSTFERPYVLIPRDDDIHARVLADTSWREAAMAREADEDDTLSLDPEVVAELDDALRFASAVKAWMQVELQRILERIDFMETGIRTLHNLSEIVDQKRAVIEILFSNSALSDFDENAFDAEILRLDTLDEARIAEEKIPAWQPTIVKRAEDDLPADGVPSSSFQFLKPTRPDRVVRTMASERPAPRPLVREHRERVMASEPKRVPRASVWDGQGEVVYLKGLHEDLGDDSSGALPIPHPATLTDEQKKLLGPQEPGELFQEWVTRFKGLEFVEYLLSLCAKNETDPEKIQQLRAGVIAECLYGYDRDGGYNPSSAHHYAMNDVLHILHQHLGEEMTLDEILTAEEWQIFEELIDELEQYRQGLPLRAQASIPKAVAGGVGRLFALVKEACTNLADPPRSLSQSGNSASENPAQYFSEQPFIVRQVREGVYVMNFIPCVYDPARDGLNRLGLSRPFQE